MIQMMFPKMGKEKKKKENQHSFGTKGGTAPEKVGCVIFYFKTQDVSRAKYKDLNPVCLPIKCIRCARTYLNALCLSRNGGSCSVPAAAAAYKEEVSRISHIFTFILTSVGKRAFH